MAELITLTEGNDTYSNLDADNINIAALGGNDSVTNQMGNRVSISGGTGNDTLRNLAEGYVDAGASVTVDGGDGNDHLYSDGMTVSLYGGAGNDSIYNLGSYTVIDGGSGNDTIRNYNLSVTISGGAGDDTIENGADSVTISGGAGDDTLTLGASSYNLINYASGDGNDVIYSYNVTDTLNITSGTYSTQRSGSDVIVSVGSGSITLRNFSDEPSIVGTPSAASLAPASGGSRGLIYTGGEQTITGYTSGEEIIMTDVYQGAFYDSSNNFYFVTTTGTLTIENAANKVVNVIDTNGNAFLKAYAATNAGVIDGRGIAGFEIINGSAGADYIVAGDYGSQLWGGNDNVADALVGGYGTDIFIGGKSQGNDYFANASSADIVHLTDVSLSDIVATSENNGVISIAFNNGTAVAIQSSEALSAAVVLKGDLIYRYNHVTKSWQGA